MPVVGTIDKLNDELKREVDNKLRENGYGELVATCKWLSETHGVKISKSALGRYSKDRKTKDKAAHLMTKDVRGSLAGKQEIDLLAELGTLRIREHRIINLLEQMGFIDKGHPNSKSKSQNFV